MVRLRRARRPADSIGLLLIVFSRIVVDPVGTVTVIPTMWESVPRFAWTVMV